MGVAATASKPGPAAPVVLVTGASRGIGHAIAAALHDAGWAVIGTSRRPADIERPPAWHMWELDVADASSRSQLADRLEPRLDAVVSNAGISALAAAEDTPPAVVQSLLGTNLSGPIELLRLLLPQLRASGGRIVTVGSLIADFPVPLQSLYAASKAGLRGYTLSLREELRGQGVSVSHLEPGDIATGIAPATGRASAPYRDAHANVAAAREREMAGAPPATQVGAAVLRVLRARRPPAIVAVGGAAPLLRQIRRLLPDRVAGRLTARRYGL